MSTDIDKLDKFFQGFAKAEEKFSFRLAHETVGERIPAISTGSYSLDDALSCGGNPRGRITQFYGPPGSGKTLVAMLGMKEAQLEDSTSRQLFIDAEQTFDPSWAAKLGLDTSRIVVIDGDDAANGRKCFEMLLGVPRENKKTHEYAGKSKDGLLDKIAAGEFNFNMIVLDSIGSIVPPGEDISRVGKMNISLLARFLTTTFRKLTLEIKRANIPFICINHKRDDMDPYKDHTFSGGNTYGHTLSANVYFEGINRKDDSLLDEEGNKVGGSIRATIEKSKFGPWPRKCEFRVDFRKGIIDRGIEIANLALTYGVVQKTSSVTHEFGDKKWVGFPKFCESIETDEALSKEIMAKVAEAREAKMEALREEQRAIREGNEPSSKKTNGKSKKKLISDKSSAATDGN